MTERVVGGVEKPAASVCVICASREVKVKRDSCRLCQNMH